MITFTLVFFLSNAAIDEGGNAYIVEGEGLSLSECAKAAVEVIAREDLYDDAPGFICSPEGRED